MDNIETTRSQYQLTVIGFMTLLAIRHMGKMAFASSIEASLALHWTTQGGSKNVIPGVLQDLKYLQLITMTNEKNNHNTGRFKQIYSLTRKGERFIETTKRAIGEFEALEEKKQALVAL